MLLKREQLNERKKEIGYETDLIEHIKRVERLNETYIGLLEEQLAKEGFKEID